MANNIPTLDKITSWAKRRGFVFPASEVYGGMANTYDYGPYGTQLKENLRALWWQKFILGREDIFGIDSTIILRPEIWEASGHTSSFADVMVEDKVNHRRYRADHLIEDYVETKKGVEAVAHIAETHANNSFQITDGQLIDAIVNKKVDGLGPEALGEIIDKLGIKSPDGNPLTEPKRFNQLFQTEVGIISGEKNKAYLRGEIAQGLFMNFKNVLDSMHPKLPFGIGQAGKAFRNEITMGKFTFRTLEFDLMEFEYFFDKDTQDWQELFEYWKAQMQDFAIQIGLKPGNLRWRAHEDFERSHYSTRTEDLEYEFTWGFKEMWGLAYRTDFDLKNHMEKSGKDLRYTYPDGEKVLPHVIEPTFGLSRLCTVVMFDAYHEEEVNGTVRTVLRFSPLVAPVQVAIFPLQKDDDLSNMAKSIRAEIAPNYRTEYDNSGNIGKMYRRQDEIGTPFCVTIDYESLKDGCVTVRERDSMAQQRIKKEELSAWLDKNLKQ